MGRTAEKTALAWAEKRRVAGEKHHVAGEKHPDEDWYGVMEALKEDIGQVAKSGRYVTIYTRDIQASLDWHITAPAIRRVMLELGARYAQIYDSALKGTSRGYYLPIHVYNQIGGHTIEEKVDRPWQRLLKREDHHNGA